MYKLIYLYSCMQIYIYMYFSIGHMTCVFNCFTCSVFRRLVWLVFDSISFRQGFNKQWHWDDSHRRGLQHWRGESWAQEGVSEFTWMERTTGMVKQDWYRSVLFAYTAGLRRVQAPFWLLLVLPVPRTGLEDCKVVGFHTSLQMLGEMHSTSYQVAPWSAPGCSGVGQSAHGSRQHGHIDAYICIYRCTVSILMSHQSSRECCARNFSCFKQCMSVLRLAALWWSILPDVILYIIVNIYIYDTTFSWGQMTCALEKDFTAHSFLAMSDASHHHLHESHWITGSHCEALEVCVPFQNKSSYGRTREPPENLSAEIDTYIYIYTPLSQGTDDMCFGKRSHWWCCFFFVCLIQMKAGPQWFHCWCHLCAWSKWNQLFMSPYSIYTI